MVFVLYFTAAYISIYQIRLSSALCLLLYVVFSLLSVLVRISASGIEARMGLEGMLDTLGGYQSPTVFFASICFFLFFQNIKIQGNRPKKIILAIAPLSFGVYLLHDSDFIRAFLWEKIALSRFGSLTASLGYPAIVTLCITCRVSCRYAVSENIPGGLSEKAEEKVDEITERIYRSIKKGE